MPLTSLLSRWKTDPSIGPNITAWKIIPKREPGYSNLPSDLSAKILTVLHQHNITELYDHQKLAWEEIKAGENLVITTGTSSGKSLAYQLPILDRISRSPKSRALLIFPTKALAQDQADWLGSFTSVITAVYDGDTPTNQRTKIRQNTQILITNPDMLHIGILPYHIQWAEFFSNLDYVVLDEMHVYRGVFGSHVANVIRRLKRLASYYGSTPQFILTSATIGNPSQLASNLINTPVKVISNDSSSRGEKHFLIYNPPVVDPRLGLRASMQAECIRLASDLISTGNQTIIFGRSRRSVEFMLRNLKNNLSPADFNLRSYRSGYLKQDRRSIESALKDGSIRGLTATNALELGVDIGGLDAAILAGYPGSVAGTWQQAGRSGRTDRPSLSILVTGAIPIDQYLSQHPEYIFGDNLEKALISPDNLLIALAHLQCAVYELPFFRGETFGSFSVDETAELLDLLEQLNKVYSQNERIFWMAEDYPAAEISLRNASNKQITLILRDENIKQRTIGSVDYESALWMVHPGAVYLHGGETYLVDKLDLENNHVYLSNFRGDYYTESERKTSFEIINLAQEEVVSGGILKVGEIKVTNTVTSYKKISWRPYQVLAREALELPSTILATTGFWLTLSQQLENHLLELALWNSGSNDYGPDWNSIRDTVLERDANQCQICGADSSQGALHVHHKQPLRSFLSLKEANQLTNLVTLCPRCHRRAESVVKVQSGVRGLAHILHSLAPLLVMCDPGDLGVHADFLSPFDGDRPFVMIYDQVPGGIGFSQSLFEQAADLFAKALELVVDCSCETGCPSCVGPGGELGSGGKLETEAILKYICSSRSES